MPLTATALTWYAVVVLVGIDFACLAQGTQQQDGKFRIIELHDKGQLYYNSLVITYAVPLTSVSPALSPSQSAPKPYKWKKKKSKQIFMKGHTG